MVLMGCHQKASIGTRTKASLTPLMRVKPEKHSAHDSAHRASSRDTSRRLGQTQFRTGRTTTETEWGYVSPAIEARRMVRGKAMIPVRWALLKLAEHGRTEPAERVLATAQCHHVKALLPPPGAEHRADTDFSNSPLVAASPMGDCRP